jgi:hypothetical protein
VTLSQLLFHNYVNECKDDVFEGGAEVIMERLSKAAEAIGHALDAALQLLAEKVIFSMHPLRHCPDFTFVHRSKFPWPYYGKGPVTILVKFEHASRSWTLSRTSLHKFNSGSTRSR